MSPTTRRKPCRAHKRRSRRNTGQIVNKPSKQRIAWPQLKALALSLNLPGVEETTTWGEPALKAHGKLWVWWSPSEDAPVFKVSLEEREILLEAAPGEFFVTPHYRPHALILVRPGALDLAWARANLMRVWRHQAPKRVLKAYDDAAAQPHSVDAPAGKSKPRPPARRKRTPGS
jgi:hypothetical protein